ncbi:RNA-directed DNA polymerase, eukaryota, reverse transcriptase zinc-binding domain protein, partial [Tanacetum coccineum]
MGDFNVTLKPKEHSNGGSGCSVDMQEFSDIANQLEVDDMCYSGFHFTWTKSLRNPTNSTLKKVDRILVNESFILQYCRAHMIFLPYLVSDHSVGLLIFPYGLPKKLKSFRFANYTADKHEFLETIEKGDIVQLKLSKEDAEAMIVEVSDKEIKGLCLILIPLKFQGL